MKIRVEKSKSQDVFNVKAPKDKNTGWSNQNNVFDFSLFVGDRPFPLVQTVLGSVGSVARVFIYILDIVF